MTYWANTANHEPPDKWVSSSRNGYSVVKALDTLRNGEKVTIEARSGD